jgi:hypothetical protein
MGAATTFAELIANPLSEKVFLCEAKPAEVITDFDLATVTLAGFTCNISLVDGTAFITNPSVDLTDYIGWKITITAGGKTLVGYIKAAGGGETLDAELITAGWTNVNFETLTNNANNRDIDSAINASGVAVAIAKNGAPMGEANKLYKWVYGRTVGSGETPGIAITTDYNGAATDLPATTAAAAGNYYATFGGARYLAIYVTAASNFSSTNSLKQVTAPSATGVTIVSASGGSTYNWTSNDGINANSASFTVTLEAVLSYKKSYLNETITLADSSTEIIRKSVAAMEIDGTALTVKTTLLEVEADSGSYWHDTANSLLYVHPADDGSPDGHTVIVSFWVYFATKGIVLDSRYYEPYIAENGIPSISQETQQIHWGASQISSGAVVLLNNRGYFDQIAKRWIWNNKDIKILLGGDSLPYSEYTSLFAGKIMQATFTKTEYSLEIQSKAFALLRNLPINNFWTSTWAELDPSAEGKPIPYYWGSYSAAQAPLVTCIDQNYDANSSQWKICDTAFHEILSITQVYIDYGAGSGWETIAHANESLANATFTIETKPIWGVTKVKVAFEGYHSGSVLIEGAPEIAEDILLNQFGYTAADLNAASLTASKAISTRALNVPIESEEAALTVIETICQSDLAFFDEDGSGLLRYRSWEPSASGTVPVLAKEDILEIPEIVDDSSQLYWKIKAGYSYLCEQGKYLYTESSDSESKYKYSRDDYLTINTYLRTSVDADELAFRLNWVTKNPSPIISLTLKAGQISKTLGEKVKVTIARAPFQTAGGYDERVFEITSKDISCFPLFVQLKGRDLMDFGNNIGFWTADTIPAWGSASAQEREDSGFWCDANGLADPTDQSSLNVSLWW